MEHYRNSLEFFPNYLIDLLDNYADQLNPKIRIKMVIALIGVRSKNIIKPIQSITAFLKLLSVQDKEMRKVVSAHIINDIKRLNLKTRNHQINKQVILNF
jgi:protein SDA1